MAARQEPEDHHHGCGRRLLVLCVLVLLAGFAAALWFIAQPQDMARIAGYRGPAPAAARKGDFPLSLLCGIVYNS